MFKKLLIANRGEIACRIARTARKMRIKTVAVYSDADKYGRHVRACDEAVYIGPSPAGESYLVIDKIVSACRRMNVDAVHPGYGFLSERTAFAKGLADEGIAFIGPNPEVIRLMGDKILANRAAKEAGVPTVPGHWDQIPTAEEAVGVAQEIGFPVMLKAAAGGGGKGIRIARDEAELKDAFRLATSEARSAFGDDRVFIEKFIEQPRHIEIQVLGDKHGNVIHLDERECSIQRRHQKVIEEAPSPFLDSATRREMGMRAVALAKSCGYDSAGTCEFIVDQRRNFYFLEMNTRLQVEHSVTEFTHGIDLVEWMIRVAAGEKLTIRQEDVQPHGWSVEARVYAEDPNRKFMPSTGRLVRYREPVESDEVRVDSGVYEGGEISMFYDPMIAKVTTWGRDRDSAIALMRRALDEFYIKGVHHNLAFLTALMANPRFLQGRLSTAFIAEEYPDGFSPAPLELGGSRQHHRRRHADAPPLHAPGEERQRADAGVWAEDRARAGGGDRQEALSRRRRGACRPRLGGRLRHRPRRAYAVDSQRLGDQRSGAPLHHQRRAALVQGRTERHRLSPLSPGRRGRRPRLH